VNTSFNSEPSLSATTGLRKSIAPLPRFGRQCGGLHDQCENHTRYDFSVVLVLQGRGLVGPATAYWCQETSAPRLECDPVGVGYAAPSFAQWRLTNTADTTLDLPPF
jgi:hypothetical protein